MKRFCIPTCNLRGRRQRQQVGDEHARRRRAVGVLHAVSALVVAGASVGVGAELPASG
jgi:hypothetical protein